VADRMRPADANLVIPLRCSLRNALAVDNVLNGIRSASHGGFLSSNRLRPWAEVGRTGANVTQRKIVASFGSNCTWELYGVDAWPRNRVKY
jgi:hypothetical protein